MILKGESESQLVENSLHHAKDRSWDKDVHTLRPLGSGKVYASLVNTVLITLGIVKDGYPDGLCSDCPCPCEPSSAPSSQPIARPAVEPDDSAIVQEQLILQSQIERR